MIKKLNHKQKDVAESVRDIFQVSYKVEADLLKAIDFPPLKRSLTNFVNSETAFFGFFHEHKLSSVIEIKSEHDNTHIQSLVVHPYFFRQGIGEKMLDFVLRTYHTPAFSVETGLANQPAISLYKKFGFIEIRQWNTNHGIRKVRYQKRT